jgi:hypothetical protein
MCFSPDYPMKVAMFYGLAYGDCETLWSGEINIAPRMQWGRIEAMREVGES